MIDHSLLKPFLTDDNLKAGIREAVFYNVASVCILPYYVKMCNSLLQESTVKTGTTVGFPHGGHTMKVKLAEAKKAIEDGGDELDMVINISKVLSNDWAYVEEEVRVVTDMVHERERKIKIIFENCYLSGSQKIKLCEICGKIGVDWVKTSTGFGTGGATVSDITLMRTYSPSHVQVKAAGGIRTLKALLQMKALGVTRVGASKTSDILDAYKKMEKKHEKRLP